MKNSFEVGLIVLSLCFLVLASLIVMDSLKQSQKEISSETDYKIIFDIPPQTPESRAKQEAILISGIKELQGGND